MRNIMLQRWLNAKMDLIPLLEIGSMMIFAIVSMELMSLVTIF